jgi:hypothetical protein
MSAPGRKINQQTARAVFYFRMQSPSRGLQGTDNSQCDKGLAAPRMVQRLGVAQGGRMWREGLCPGRCLINPVGTLR